MAINTVDGIRLGLLWFACQMPQNILGTVSRAVLVTLLSPDATTPLTAVTKRINRVNRSGTILKRRPLVTDLDAG